MVLLFNIKCYDYVHTYYISTTTSSSLNGRAIKRGGGGGGGKGPVVREKLNFLEPF